jgi:hypothetical protein
MNKRMLTNEQARAVLMWWAERQRVYREYRKVPNPRRMAQRLGICPGTLYSIVRGERYKDVQG